MKLHPVISLWVELRECIRAGLGAIATHKLRSGLSLLGVLIGVFSIVVVMTAVRVLQNYVETELSSLGANTFRITKWPVLDLTGSGDWQRYWRRKNLTYAQVVSLRERARLPIAVGAEIRFTTASFRSSVVRTATKAQVYGIDAGAFTAKGRAVAQGRPLLDVDVQNRHRVCLLGSDLAKTLFPGGVGEDDRVWIDDIPYRVVGVLEPSVANVRGARDQFALIPITTGFSYYGGTRRSVEVLVQAPSRDLYQDTVEEVRGILRIVRNVPPREKDDFEVSSNESLVREFRRVTSALRTGVAVISSIALLTAGIGIMNIMLVSVTERTREIGIRRAVGARRRNILMQFTLEAVVLCQLGGVFGVVLGILGGNAAALVLKLPPVIPFDWVCLGLLICSVVGVAFGIYPAFRAANVDPIEALRYE